MLRLVHCADVHLDTPFTGSGLSREQARQRRRDLLTVFQRITALTAERKADALLIAGDLFEEEYLNLATFHRAMAAIAELSPTPAIISPGNHDPFHPGSPWATEELPPNAHLFRSDTIEVKRFPELQLAVWGTAFTAYQQTDRRWRDFSIEERAEGEAHVICTHGAVYRGEAGQADRYLPIAEDDLRSSGADYVALGHYHTGFDVLTDPFTQSVRAAYPGSPEPLRLSDEGEHGVIIVSLDADGPAVSVTCERVQTQIRSCRRVAFDVTTCTGIEEIDARVKCVIADPTVQDDIVEITLTGRISPDIHIDPADYQDSASGLFALTVKDRTAPAYDFEAIAGEDTARGAFCRLMNQRLQAAEEEQERDELNEALHLGLAAFDGQDVGEIPL